MIAWMLRMVVASALIGVAAWLLERVLRASGAPLRWAWAGGLVAVVAAPFVALVLPRAAGVGGGLLDARFIANSSDIPAGGIPALQSVDPGVLVGVVWLLAVAVAAMIYGAGWWKLRSARRVWRRGRVAGASVLVSAGAGPAAVGVLEPAIVVPEWLLGEDESVQRLVVLHEAEHLAAGDHVVLAVAPLALVLMPWNLPLWWMIRRLRLAIELDCDGRVLARGVAPAEYGSLLLDVAGRRGVGAYTIALASPRSALERRIEALAGALPGMSFGRVTVVVAASAACVALACGVAPVAPLDRGQDVAHEVSLDTMPEELIRRFGGETTAWVIDGRTVTESEVRALRAGIAMVQIEENSTRSLDGTTLGDVAASVVNIFTPAYLAANPELAEREPIRFGEHSPVERIRALLSEPDLHVVIDGRESDVAALESLADSDIARLEVMRTRTGDGEVMSGVNVRTRGESID